MPRVLLAWTAHGEPADHVGWVESLAARLRAGGVEVVLDRWDLDPGASLDAFHEDVIGGTQHVLSVCTPAYKVRFDGHLGGNIF